MASPTEKQLRRWKVAPDRLLAWLGVTGLACYGALWVVHQAFYSEFGVSVFTVGVGQAQMVTSAAVFALWLVPPIIYPAVLVRFVFSTAIPKGARVPALEAAFGLVLLAGTVMLFVWVAPLPDTLRGTDNNLSGLFVLVFFVASAAFLSIVLLFKVANDLLRLKVYPLALSVVKWWRIRRYLRRNSSSEAVWRIYMPARRIARKRAARRRATWRHDLQRAGRTYWLALA
jgi:hypothetical protein